MSLMLLRTARHSRTCLSTIKPDVRPQSARCFYNGPRGDPLPVTENTVLLGIETSADDSAAAVIDRTGRVLGESRLSQFRAHREFGGIWPERAGCYHRENLPPVVAEAMRQAGKEVGDLSAVAFTLGPGLSPCLEAGCEYAAEMARSSGVPLIPVHHMHAHALTARLSADAHDLEFPYLVCLVSGGHCTFAVVEDVSTLKVLGSRVQKQNPGSVLDKVAYLLRLHKNPDLEHLVPGAAIEMAAKQGNPQKYKFSWPQPRRHCQSKFSFFPDKAKSILVDLDKDGDESLPVQGYADVAASLQNSMMLYISHLAERAMLFTLGEYPAARHIVISGGVASNSLLRELVLKAIQRHELPLSLVAPEPRLCTDNGVMIAWAGMEYLNAGIAPMAVPEVGNIWHIPRLAIGEDISEKLIAAQIKLRRTQFQQ